MIFSPRNLKWVKDSINFASSFTQEIIRSDFIIIIYIYIFLNKNYFNIIFNTTILTEFQSVDTSNSTSV